MSEHRIRRELWLPQPPEEVFEFFSAAHNLERITPPWLNFRILTADPIVMDEGTLIAYKLRIHGVPQRWLTKITRWNPPHEFADVQIKGPYKVWDHTHRFLPANGGTRMVDEVRYELPFGALGDLVHSLFVRSDVETIFNYRNEWIAGHFGAKASEKPAAVEAVK